MSYNNAPQFVMVLGDATRPVKSHKAVKVEAIKSLKPLPRWNDLPDEIRYAMRLRDMAFMESVLS
jgi:hypothetical protein